MPAANTATDMKGVEDAAILMMVIGEEQAAEVFKHLLPKEVQKLGEAISRVTSVPRERYEAALEKLVVMADESSIMLPDSEGYVRAVLRRALGDEKASLLLDRILQGNDVTGIESLKWMDPHSVAELLRNEHPQIVSAILVHLENSQSSEVLRHFPDRQRNEVLIRIATLDSIQPTALNDLNEVLSRMLSGGDRARKNRYGGVKAAAEVLNQLGSSIETSVLDYIRDADEDLAQRIMDNMFSFDDIIKLDDKSIQALLREVQSDSLIVSMKAATPELREAIFRNMSTRAAETMREDLESRGPIRVSEVEAEQKEVLKTVRRLVDEGQIQLPGGSDDEFV